MARCWVCGKDAPLDGGGNLFQHLLQTHPASPEARAVRLALQETFLPLERLRKGTP
jgi:hypothetical protein